MVGADSSAGLFQVALGEMRAGQSLASKQTCQRALALNPNHADSLNLIGLLHLNDKQYDSAVEWFSRAIRLEPRADFLTGLGGALIQLGRHDDAIKVFDKAVELDPKDADGWRKRGVVLAHVGRPAAAIQSFEHALKLDPRHREAAYGYGTLLQQQGRFDEALVQFELCDRLRPGDPQTLYVLARALGDLRRHEEALDVLHRLLQITEPVATICNLMGVTHQGLSRHEEALIWFDRSLEKRPNDLKVLNNKGVSLFELQRFDEALAVYRQAKRVDPAFALTDWNLSFLHLLRGNLAEGWVLRESRWTAEGINASSAKFFNSASMWLGTEPIAGKAILVWADEGFGDTIQFVRYVPRLAARGARVILVVDKAQCSLLSELSGVSHCLALSDEVRLQFDFHCPITSLPLAMDERFQTTPEQRYLPLPSADRVKVWEDRLGSHDRLRVGLVWSGSANQGNDRNRSMSLRMLSRILDVEATFVSLQKAPRPADKATLLESPEIIDLTDHLTDFAETAALCSCLDLVIAVDSSVAHLAAALGRPTWILLSWTPSFRWLLDRDDSPWYPTVRLFRQNETRDYASVIDRVRTELVALVAAASTRCEAAG